jgi:hypothetical protein
MPHLYALKSGMYVRPSPPPPTPQQRECHRKRQDQQRRDGRRIKAAAGPIDRAGPQRRRFSVARQTKRDHAVADRGAGFGMTARDNGDILLAAPGVGHGIGDARRRQSALPQLGSARRVERAQIGIQRAGEDQPPRGHQHPVQQRRAPMKRHTERPFIFRGADARAPSNFAGSQIHGDKTAPWRRIAQQSHLRACNGAHHRKRRAALRAKVAAAAGLHAFSLIGGNELDDVHRRRDVGVENLVDGIEGHAAPVHAAAGHRKQHGALYRWRRVEAFVARSSKLRAAGFAAEKRRQPRGIIRRDRL